MSFSRRAVITLAAMVLASLVVGMLWKGAFDARIPSYLSGLVGGVSSLQVWEWLRSWK